MKKSDKFEGWYFKLQKDETIIAFIPSMHRTKDKVYAMLQIVTDNGDFSFRFDEFETIEPFGLKLGSSEFSACGIILDLKDGNFSASGKIDFGEFAEIKGDIMGPFRFLPRMECRHGIISMRHSVSGRIEINGRVYDLDGGTGYIEKDSGRSFPSDYCWTHGMTDDLSVMVAVAKIPYMGLRFRGCICNILYKDKEYRLATYNGGKGEVGGDRITVKKGRLVLEVTALERSDHALAAPVDGDMTRTVHESPACKVRYKFTDNGEIVFDEVCTAGFETDTV